MAIVKNPGLSSEASGNLGGICYSRWRELQIARKAWEGTVPNTPAQQTYQDCLDMAARWWSDYHTPGQRKEWEDLAKGEVWKSRLGTEFRPSGYNLYMKRTMLRCVVGLTPMFPPLLPQLRRRLTSIRIAYGISPNHIECRTYFAAGGELPYVVQYWRAGPFDGGGRRAIAGEYRLVYQEADPGDAFHWSDYLPEDSKWYWYKVRGVWEWGEACNFFYCHGQRTYTGEYEPSSYCRENS